MIESFQNEKIKYITRLLTDNRFRKKEDVFVVEGKQENERALKFGFKSQEFYIADAIFNDNLPEGKVHLVSEKIYDKIAYRGSSEGIIGIYKSRISDLKDFTPEKNSTVIIVESIEKPGNLGAILRSCEAFGIDALIVTDAKVDFYNPNVIRSSVGCLFGMNLFYSSNDEVYQFLTENNYHIYTTIMDTEAENVQTRNLKDKSAVVFGTEHSGLTDFWIDKGKNTVIPMSGSIDSLNLSNAVAICCYETLRQKML
ncbi:MULTISPECIES: RNA methyltransferase [unclassified Kaistella]|uniref:TrmH family RNA methyltransferase n=1 Tax=unclassified Kaistella TaxID=2762626 RepID=UPI002732B2AF|nr:MULTISPECIES: TrmH family RNA methyltransferase [unclassified Kaistella]MDP2454371.1 TrmH family RNA methyltransferase [Kaistella sp. SH11-4b]MDP2457858.1 TrmH family RNA methyltransferase [Kaistella sp. SH40-3]MDP2460764.1 TrmH family RNA methyltransferase [Kaistella sp. SH19-2b]